MQLHFFCIQFTTKRKVYQLYRWRLTKRAITSYASTSCWKATLLAIIKVSNDTKCTANSIKCSFVHSQRQNRAIRTTTRRSVCVWNKLVLCYIRHLKNETCFKQLTHIRSINFRWSLNSITLNGKQIWHRVSAVIDIDIFSLDFLKISLSVGWSCHIMSKKIYTRYNVEMVWRDDHTVCFHKLSNAEIRIRNIAVASKRWVSL